MNVVELRDVTITYPLPTGTVLHHVTMSITEGEWCLVAGPTGSGKSTLLGVVSGLVPHMTGGRVSGGATVGGFNTAVTPPRQLAGTVGTVMQNPVAGFVTSTVEEELAFTTEQLGVPPDVMRTRVEDTLDLLGLASFRDRPLHTLSGGQAQRVAIGAVLTANPRVLVLDEPTSALDPTAAEEVLAAVSRLVHDLGVTVVMAEHRLERVLGFADTVAVVAGDGTVQHGSPSLLAGPTATDVAPPVVRLGQGLGLKPVPTTVREARRATTQIRQRLENRIPPAAVTHRSPPGVEPVLKAEKVDVTYPGVRAVSNASVTVNPGDVVALMGRNGSGKSSLLWALQGSGRRDGGTVKYGRGDGTKMIKIDDLTPEETRNVVSLVPQTPSDLLYRATVAAECEASDKTSQRTEGTTLRIIRGLAPTVDPATHPRDCSEGQRLAVALAIQLVANPWVVLLDEPSRGLDYRGKRVLADNLSELAESGRGIIVATHDVELAAITASRVVVMAEGEIIADDTAAAVLAGSAHLAPQMSRVMTPGPWLTVEQVITSAEDLAYEAQDRTAVLPSDLRFAPAINHQKSPNDETSTSWDSPSTSASPSTSTSASPSTSPSASPSTPTPAAPSQSRTVSGRPSADRSLVPPPPPSVATVPSRPGSAVTHTSRPRGKAETPPANAPAVAETPPPVRRGNGTVPPPPSGGGR